MISLCFTEICSTEYIQTHFPQIIDRIKCKENQNTVIASYKVCKLVQQWYKTLFIFIILKPICIDQH